MTETLFCRCGCNRELPPRTGKAGRRRQYATKYCMRVVSEAKLAGWHEGMEQTAREYLLIAKESAKPLTRGDVKRLAKEEAEVELVNPRICTCGCGRPAVFATRQCALKAFREERQAKKTHSLDMTAPEGDIKTFSPLDPPWKE